MALMEWRDVCALIMSYCRTPQPTRGLVSLVPQGAILTDAVIADIDSPPFRKALMDGFALAGAVPRSAEGWPIVGGNLAGQDDSTPLESGVACRIATGAKLPPGADRVVPREWTREAGETVVVDRAGDAGDFIAEPGSDFRKSDTLVFPGAIFNAGTAAALATAGMIEAGYMAPPKVAVVSTGSELIEADQTPSGSKIRNSNGPMLVAALKGAGAIPTYLGMATDDESALTSLLARGLELPAMVITGGVSVGDKDLVRSCLEGLGVQVLVHGVRLKPGKPFLFGVGPGGQLVFGLPGNPTSSLANFDLFVRPAIFRMRGYTNPGPFWQKATLAQAIQVDNNRPTMRPVRIGSQIEPLRVYDLGAKGSFEAGILGRADAWLFLEPGKWELPEGAEVSVLIASLAQAWAELGQGQPSDR